jgi:type V secretory pathway adhesin AidA
MGSVSVSQLATRGLRVTATGVPQGGKLEIVQGAVDYAGPQEPVATTQVITTLPDTALATGTVDVAVETRQSSFIRAQVRNSAGTVIALSNPVWLLRETPPGGQGIPVARAC